MQKYISKVIGEIKFDFFINNKKFYVKTVYNNSIYQNSFKVNKLENKDIKSLKLFVYSIDFATYKFENEVLILKINETPISPFLIIELKHKNLFNLIKEFTDDYDYLIKNLQKYEEEKKSVKKEVVQNKNKFNLNEIVFCVDLKLSTYTSIIIDIRCNKHYDEVQYKVHYLGWVKKWDEWVDENRITKFNYSYNFIDRIDKLFLKNGSRTWTIENDTFTFNNLDSTDEIKIKKYNDIDDESYKFVKLDESSELDELDEFYSSDNLSSDESLNDSSDKTICKECGEVATFTCYMYHKYDTNDIY